MSTSNRVRSCEDLAADRLARAMAAELDAEIFIHHLQSTDGTDIIERSAPIFEKLGVGEKSAATLFSLTAILSCLQQVFPSSALLWSSFLSDRFERISIAFESGTEGYCSRLTSASLAAIASNMQAGLKELIIDELNIDDGFLVALSKSPAARTLTGLVLRASEISDASASAWKQLQKLEKIDLNRSESFSMATIEQICTLTRLRELSVECDQLEPAEICKALKKHNINKISKLAVSYSGMVTSQGDDRWANFLTAVTAWPGRSNVTSFTIGKGIGESYYMELFALFPRLQLIESTLEVDQIAPRLNSLERLTGLRVCDSLLDYEGAPMNILLNNAAETLTNLQTLSAWGVPSGYAWFEKMSHLTTLDLQEKAESEILTDPINFPADLTTLTVNFARTSSDLLAVESVLDQICRHIVLRDLNIGQSDKISLNSLNRILKSLPNLTSLSLDNGYSAAQPDTPQLLIVSHEKIKKMNFYSEDPFFCLKFQTVPCLEEIDLAAPVAVRALFDSLNSVDQKPYIPSLKRLHIVLNRDCAIAECEIASGLAEIRRSCPDLRSIWWYPTNLSKLVFDSLAAFTQLTKLSISASTSDSEIDPGAMLRALPWLTEFIFRGAHCDRAANWYHPRLKDLRLGHIVSSPMSVISFEFNSINFPRLVQFEIASECTIGRAKLANMGQLKSVLLRRVTPIAANCDVMTEISFDNCPALTEIHLDYIFYPRVTLSKLAALRLLRMGMTMTDLATFGTISPVECPNLKKIEFGCPFTSDDEDEEEPQQRYSLLTEFRAITASFPEGQIELIEEHD